MGRDELDIRLPGSRPARRAGLRAEAEAEAASKGLTRGSPGWGAAIRHFVLNGPWRTQVVAAREPASEGPETVVEEGAAGWPGRGGRIP